MLMAARIAVWSLGSGSYCLHTSVGSNLCRKQQVSFVERLSDRFLHLNVNIFIYIYTHTFSYAYIYICTHVCTSLVVVGLQSDLSNGLLARRIGV